MRHHDGAGGDRPFADRRDDQGRHGGHHKHRGRHGRHGRPFDYGELRLLTLGMIAEQPRHGYELMRAIEERMGGSYSPSPGVMYPTLSWLEDMGYVQVTAEDNGRRRHGVTPEGQAFLTANRLALDDLTARIGSTGPESRHEGVPAPVTRAMENLKVALRLRLRRGPLDQSSAETIADALDAAAKTVERS